MKFKKISLMAASALIAGSLAAEAQALPIVLDICAGADQAQTIDPAGNPVYRIESPSVTKGGTYGSGTQQFGCPLDTPDNSLGVMNIQETYFVSLFQANDHFNNDVLVLKDGQITIGGFSNVSLVGNGFAAVDYPVTGGTGKYAGITGVAHFVPLNGPEARLTIKAR